MRRCWPPKGDFVDPGFSVPLTSPTMSTLLLSQLGVICPRCDQLNARGIPRCTACQTSLVDAAPAAHAAKHPRTGAGPSSRASSPIAENPNSPSPARPANRIPVLAPSSGTPQPSSPPLPKAAAPPMPAALQPPVEKGLNLTVLAGPRRGQRYRVASPCVIGRTRGTLLFPEDPFISPQHASLAVRDGQVLLRDDGSVSGVFVAISGQEAIPPNSYFCAGQRLFRYLGAIASPTAAPSEVTVYGAPLPEGSQLYAVEELLVGGRSGCATLSGQPVCIGRLDCDLSFPADEGLALRHCELVPSAQGAILRDLSAGLGTFVRLAPGVERPVKAGDQVRIGQAVLLLESVG